MGFHPAFVPFTHGVAMHYTMVDFVNAVNTLYNGAEFYPMTQCLARGICHHRNVDDAYNWLLKAFDVGFEARHAAHAADPHEWQYSVEVACAMRELIVNRPLLRVEHQRGYDVVTASSVLHSDPDVVCERKPVENGMISKRPNLVYWLIEVKKKVSQAQRQRAAQQAFQSAAIAMRDTCLCSAPGVVSHDGHHDGCIVGHVLLCAVIWEEGIDVYGACLGSRPKSQRSRDASTEMCLYWCPLVCSLWDNAKLCKSVLSCMAAWIEVIDSVVYDIPLNFHLMPVPELTHQITVPEFAVNSEKTTHNETKYVLECSRNGAKVKVHARIPLHLYLEPDWPGINKCLHINFDPSDARESHVIIAPTYGNAPGRVYKLYNNYCSFCYWINCDSRSTQEKITHYAGIIPRTEMPVRTEDQDDEQYMKSLLLTVGELYCTRSLVMHSNCPCPVWQPEYITRKPNMDAIRACGDDYLRDVRVMSLCPGVEMLSYELFGPPGREGDVQYSDEQLSQALHQVDVILKRLHDAGR